MQFDHILLRPRLLRLRLERARHSHACVTKGLYRFARGGDSQPAFFAFLPNSMFQEGDDDPILFSNVLTSELFDLL